MIQRNSSPASAPRSQASAEVASHTPAPWYINVAAGPTQLAAVNPFRDVGCCFVPTDARLHDLGKANAAFIVKAVNSYYEMVEALEKIAAMDPKGIRADDLGRAARIAAEGIRVSVSSQKEPPRHSGEQS